VPSQHRHPSHGFRPDPGEYAAARDRLQARGRTVGAYLRACLRWLNHDPDAALAALAGNWPEPRQSGRPRRRTGTPLPAPQPDGPDGAAPQTATAPGSGKNGRLSNDGRGSPVLLRRTFKPGR
jgi:hypothetical protein